MKLPLTFALACASFAALRAAAPDVALSGPEVRKLDWNTRMLQAADIDGDGRTDLLVANNDRGTIDILRQLTPGEARAAAASGRPSRTNRWEPVVEDARFQLDRVTTGVSVYDLATGDLNGDGRLDLVYTGDPQALTVQYHNEDGSWTELRVTEAPAPSQGVVSLRVGDVDGDGRADVVMLGQKELAIFLQNESGELSPPSRLPLADEGCFGLEILDLDGDGRRDLAYIAANKPDALRVRLQGAPGVFGPEQAYAIKDSRSTLQLLVAPDAAKKIPARLVFAQDRTGELEFFDFEPAKPRKGRDRDTLALRPRVFTPRAPGKTPAAYAMGDIDGDGREDVVMADADGAQVFVYFRQPDGGFSVAERFPSFSDVRAIAAADWDGDGRAELFVSSIKEQSVGVASLTPEGRLGYPKPLPGAGRPLGVAAGALAPGAKPSLVVLREEKGKRWFDVVTRSADGAATVASTVQLSGLKTDPRGVRLVDANQDGLLDVAVFTPLDALRLFIQAKDGTFAESSVAGMRKGLVDNLDLSALSSGDVNGDGKAELLVSAGGGFTRALRIDAEGELSVADQFNARDTASEVTAAFVLPPAKGKRPEVVLYDRKGEQFQRLRANKQGVYEVVDGTPSGRIDATGSETRTGAQGTELFLFGKDRFWWLPLGRPELTVRSVENYATDLPGINYADVLAGDLTGDGKAELIALDPEANVIEVLAYDASAKRWESRMHFRVFENDEHFQNRREETFEPREMVVADVTGDGKKDLVLLVHDRVLVYPQE